MTTSIPKPTLTSHWEGTLAELLEENEQVKADPRYSRRLVSVYCNLTDEEAQLVAVKHNRQQSFVHQMTTQDKVWICMLCM